MDKSMAKRVIAGVCHSDPMTKDGEYCLTLDELVEFGRAAEIAEREACAAICDDRHHSWRFGEGEESVSGPKECAEAIRARSNP